LPVTASNSSISLDARRSNSWPSAVSASRRVVAVEQAHVEHELELAHRRAERRLRQVQALGGLAKAAEFGDRAECLQLAKRHIS